MSNPKMKRTELVELIIDAGTTASRFPYPDIPQLRDDTTQDIIITGLRTYSVENMPNSANGNAVATTAQLTNSFLTLYIEGEESVRRLPLIDLLNNFQNGSNTVIAGFLPQELEFLKVDWNKSYIEAGLPYDNEDQFSIMLRVDYKRLEPGMWAAMQKGKVKGW